MVKQKEGTGGAGGRGGCSAGELPMAEGGQLSLPEHVPSVLF